MSFDEALRTLDPKFQPAKPKTATAPPSLLQALQMQSPGYVASSVDNPRGLLSPSPAPGSSPGSIAGLYEDDPLTKISKTQFSEVAKDQIQGGSEGRKRLSDPNSLDSRMAAWDIEHLGFATFGDTGGLRAGMARAREEVRRRIAMDLAREADFRKDKSAFAELLDQLSGLVLPGDVAEKVLDEDRRGGVGDHAQMILDMFADFGRQLDKAGLEWTQGQVDAILPDAISVPWEGGIPRALQQKVEKARADLLRGYYGGLLNTPARWIGGIASMPSSMTDVYDPDLGGPNWKTFRGLFPENPFDFSDLESGRLTPKEFGQKGRSDSSNARLNSSRSTSEGASLSWAQPRAVIGERT